jgi:anti-sigma regulatory factor (Ser/Thr protein kinase)
VTAAATAATADPGAAPAFRHEAFLYRGEEEFLTGVAAFVREGLEDGDAVVVAEPADRLALLREELAGDPTDGVRFLEMGDIGANPGRILGVWALALAEATAAGHRLRGVGEPAYPGRRPQEFDECFLHELLFAPAFDDGPAWRLMCPYDVGRLPAAAHDRALRSHPEWSTVAGRGPTGADLADALDRSFSARLPVPSGPVLRGTFGAGDIPAVRHTVGTWARSCRLAPEQVEGLELAASELATNAVVHGAGTGTVAMWADPRAAVLEVGDAGRLTDPLVGRFRPEPGREGGAGLYLTYQLCDLVQVRSGSSGTAVRVTAWR